MTNVEDSLKKYVGAYTDKISEELFKDPTVFMWMGEFKRSDIERYTKHHLRAIINAIRFDDIHFLNESMEFVYRVYLTRGVQSELLIKVFEAAKRAAPYFFTAKEIMDIQTIFDYILSEHEEILKKAANPKSAMNPDDAYYDVQKQLYDLVMESKVDEAEQMCAQYIEKHGLNIFFYQVMRIVMMQVGYDWESNKIDYSKEHMVSSIFDKMLETFLWEESPKSNHLIMVATPPGESHHIGAKSFVRYLANEGYKSVLIHPKSIEEVVEQIEVLNPAVLALSVTLPNNVYEVAEIIHGVHKALPGTRTRFAVGGQAIEYFHEPLASIGADAYLKTPQDAILCFKEWLNL